MNYKTCTSCHLHLQISHFNRRTDTVGVRYTSHCKACKADYDTTRREDRLAYNKTSKGREASKRYFQSEKGRNNINFYNKETLPGKYNAYKRSAKQRNIQFSLTKEDFQKYWQLPCTYCGDTINTLGLDRVENSRGYTVDNVVPCCTTCNRMKLTFSKEEWFSQMNKILNFKDNYVNDN